MSWKHLALMFGVTLAACSQADPNDNTAADIATPAPADNVLAKIATYNQAQIELVLFRAIRDAGQDCPDVATAKRVGALAGRPAWYVMCRGKLPYLVTIGADGVANVTDGRRVRGAS